MSYEFTADWHTARIPLWKELLKHLVGKPCRCLEIGSYEGRSAVWTVENLLSDPTATLQCVDTWKWPEIERRFDANIVATGRSNQVKKTKAASHHALRWPPLDHYDFIYVDGAHEALNVIEDACLSFRLVKVGGVIIFDDYLWPDSEKKHKLLPKVAIDSFLEIYQHHVEVLHRGYQIACRRTK